MQRWWRWEPVGLSPFETQRARLMWRALIVLAAAPLPMAAIHAQFLPDPHLAIVPLCTTLVASALLGVLRAGHGIWAARGYQCWITGASAVLMMTLGGIEGPGPFLAILGATWAVLFLPGVEAFVSVVVLGALVHGLPVVWPVPPAPDAATLLGASATIALVAFVGGSSLDAMRVEEERAAQRAEERRAATAEALEANHAKSHFLATMSHELRTPLNAILGYAGLLRDVPGPADGELQQVEIAGSRLLHLVEDLLEIARVDANVTPLQLEDVDLTEVVVAAVASAGVACTLRTPERPIVVRTDRARVRRILVNLVREAGAAHAPPELALVARAGGANIVLHHAAGPVPAGWAERAFEPFARLQPESGTGLALNLALRLAKQVGGDVRVDATERGVAFTLSLPDAR